MKKSSANPGESAATLITNRIAEYPDWRGDTLAQVRRLIQQADPAVVEEWKWGTPVWSHGGILCTGEVYKSIVKLTFPKGASLRDPSRLFNSSLEGNARRAIDIPAGSPVDEPALAALIQAAIVANAPGSKPATKKPAAKKKAAAKKSAAKKSAVSQRAARKSAAKKPAAKKRVAAKPVAKKRAAKKVVTGKRPAKKVVKNAAKKKSTKQ